jgi:site-specific recombinase XerD
LLGKVSAASKDTLIGFIDQFVQDCEKGIRLSPKRQKLKPSSISSYKTTQRLIDKFQQQAKIILTLKDFSQSDIDKFSDYLIISEELAMNTHAKSMMDLLQIIKYAVKQKRIPAAKMVELEFDTRREETDSIYLTEDQILEMLQINDFDEPVHEVVRDIFVLGCFTGMRFSDYSSIDTTFNRIIKLVGEKLPSLHVPFTKQVTYKRERVELVEMKYAFLQTHTARRSFCSNEYLKGTDPLIIMSISGHKSHKSFTRYIKVSGDQFADKLEKIWALRSV